MMSDLLPHERYENECKRAFFADSTIDWESLDMSDPELGATIAEWYAEFKQEYPMTQQEARSAEAWSE